MADSKISALPASTTPLAGTEVLPIVQSSATKQVTVANLTAGRAISATQLTLTTGNLIVASGQGIDFSATPGTGTSELLSDYEEGTFTPTITSGVGSITTLGTVNGQYTKIGNKYIVNINAGITVNGLGSGYIIMAGLPTAGSGTQLIGSGNENAVTGKALTMSSITNSSIAVTFYDATYPGASGANLRVCLVYQA